MGKRSGCFGAYVSTITKGSGGGFSLADPPVHPGADSNGKDDEVKILTSERKSEGLNTTTEPVYTLGLWVRFMKDAGGQSSSCALCQPSFSSLIVFYVAIAFLFAYFSKTQIEFLHVRIFLELFYGVIQNNSSVFHDIAVIGNI